MNVHPLCRYFLIVQRIFRNVGGYDRSQEGKTW